MIEYLVGANKSYVLTQEIKKISKIYIKEKIEFDYITKNSGQKVTFILTEGRLYITCTDYAEVFGYNQGNLKSKIENLDFFNLRDREIIYGLLELYDLIIEKYIERYEIKKDEKNINTEILQEIVRNKNITEKDMEFIKKSKLLQDIEYSKIEFTDEKSESNSIKENENKKNEKEKNKKFYF